MARYRRYRRTIIRAPKKKWCSNMVPIELEANAVNVGTQDEPRWTLALGSSLAVNKTETSSPTPVVVKTGNFKLQVDIYLSQTYQPSDSTIVIIYCPEGIAPQGALAIKDVMLKHPEWVIAWRKLDVDYTPTSAVPGTSSARVIISSRLKRNLNSGDNVNVYLFSTLGASQNSSVHMTGVCQFWTCAN